MEQTFRPPSSVFDPLSSSITTSGPLVATSTASGPLTATLLAGVPPPPPSGQRGELAAAADLVEGRILLRQFRVAGDREQVAFDSPGDLHYDVAGAVRLVVQHRLDDGGRRNRGGLIRSLAAEYAQVPSRAAVQIFLPAQRCHQCHVE